MRALNILLFFSIISLPTHAKNFALIVGGSDQIKENEQGQIDENQFIDGMSKFANGLQNKGWETSVLFDSDYKPSEWNQFNKSLRPNKPGDKSGHFSLENFERLIDELLTKKAAKNGDQVEIYLNIHGGVFGGRHVIGWEDSRGKNAFSILTSAVKDTFTPTKEISTKIQRLLERGIRVHLSTGSCYDGQILKDFEPLINKYPQLLCITTSTMSDRPSYEFYNSAFIEGLISSQDPKSVFEIFKKSQHANNQISSLIRWTNLQEKTVPKFADDHMPSLTSEQKAEAFCSLSQLLFTLPLSPGQLAFITNGSALPLTQEMRHCEMLREICTDKYNAQLSEKYEQDVTSLRKKYDLGYITLTPQLVPNLFIKKENMYTIETSQYRTGVSSGHGDTLADIEILSSLYAQDMTKLSQREKKGMEELSAIVNKNKRLRVNITGFSREVEELKKKYGKLTCDHKALNASLVRLKQTLMDIIADKPEAAGCKNFKI